MDVTISRYFPEYMKIESAAFWTISPTTVNFDKLT